MGRSNHAGPIPNSYPLKFFTRAMRKAGKFYYSLEMNRRLQRCRMTCYPRRHHTRLDIVHILFWRYPSVPRVYRFRGGLLLIFCRKGSLAVTVNPSKFFHSS
jgi:hypothetical protein